MISLGPSKTLFESSDRLSQGIIRIASYIRRVLNEQLEQLIFHILNAFAVYRKTEKICTLDKDFIVGQPLEAVVTNCFILTCSFPDTNLFEKIFHIFSLDSQLGEISSSTPITKSNDGALAFSD